PGDVIVRVDGQTVLGINDLVTRIRERAVGSTVVLTVSRDGQRFSRAVELEERPQGRSVSPGARGAGRGRRGGRSRPAPLPHRRGPADSAGPAPSRRPRPSRGRAPTPRPAGGRPTRPAGGWPGGGARGRTSAPAPCGRRGRRAPSRRARRRR